jgi:hypothetical protein
MVATKLLLSIVATCALVATCAGVTRLDDLLDCNPEFNSSCSHSSWLKVDNFTGQTWLWSVLGMIVVGLSGVFPLLVMPIGDGADLTNGGFTFILYYILFFDNRQI